MSTLVYLTRVKSKLHHIARGLRCTAHGILLASLILAAKYLNDSSPNNRHWANHTHIDTGICDFSFTRIEVNLMEKQLLFLLDWNLRIVDHDLYRELDSFLDPIRHEITYTHVERMRERGITNGNFMLPPLPADLPVLTPTCQLRQPPSLPASTVILLPFSTTALAFKTNPFANQAPLRDSLCDFSAELSTEREAVTACIRTLTSPARKLCVRKRARDHYHQNQHGVEKKCHYRGMWSCLFRGRAMK